MPDKFRKYKSLYSSTANTFSTGESVTITPASVVGLPTDTEITLTFDRLDSSGNKTPDKMERIRGTVSGSNFVVSSGGRAVEGTEQVHTSPVVEMIWNADDWNDTVDGILEEHGQDGVHSDALVTSLKATGAEIDTGTEDAKIVTPKAIADSSISSMWTPARETWAYASATTITVPSGAASKYSVGDKIKLTQTTVKYFYIVGVADTVLTVTGGSDYSVADTTITDNFYSKSDNPQGFPAVFNWTPVFTGFSADPTNLVFTFSIKQKWCFFNIRMGTNGTSNSDVFSVSQPVVADTNTNNFWMGCHFYVDNGTLGTAPGRWSIQGGSTNISFFKDTGTTGWTTSGGKRTSCQGLYEIN
jgi:hypothetical protein